MPGFYTGDGDDGTTGVLGEGRIAKHHPRAEALGALDEAAASLGLARSMVEDPAARTALETVQRHLYQMMAEVAAPGDQAERFRTIGADQVRWLESRIDEWSGDAEAVDGFILGGDTPPGGALDLARTVVRRAERRLARLKDDGGLENPHLLAYLNRLSSLCFVLILRENRLGGIDRATRARS